MSMASRCPQCDQPLTHVGDFSVCPQHGLVSPEKPFAPLRIFLSYGHDANEELVCRIRADLEKRGHDVWFDKNEIKAGDDWRRSITEGIAGSHKFLSFLSKHSTRDPGVCRDEIIIALTVKGGNIQTILVEREEVVQPPVNIGHIQWLDMHDWQVQRAKNEAAWEEWYQSKLAEIVRVVESDESRRFAGEIETLRGHLRPIKSEARICQLLSKGFYGREWLFEALETWRLDTKLNSRLFWIMGAPGVGKSAFAAQLAHTRADTVIAAQFCDWSMADHRDARRVVRSLAFQLATRLPDYRKLLLTLPEIENLDLKNPDELFDYLLANPLRSVIKGGRQRYLMVIDALDEAGEAGSNPLVEMLARNAQGLPDWLGLVVTSRPEFDVKTPLQALNPVPLDTSSEANRADIRDYLRCELASQLHNRSDTDRCVEQILEKSEGVFLYVERFCHDVHRGYLSLDRPEQFPQGIGGFFCQYFQRQFPVFFQYERIIEPALGVILAARESLPVDMLRSLFDWREAELSNWRRSVGSLFTISTEHGLEVIHPYHKALADWLTNKDQAGAYFVSINDGHKLLTDYCLQSLQGTNSCPSPYIRRNIAAHLLTERRWESLIEAIDLPLLGLMDRWTARGEQAEGAICLARLIEYLGDGGDGHRAAAFGTQLARLLTQLGDHAGAEMQLHQALARASSENGTTIQRVALHELGSLLLYRGRNQEAEEYYERALRLAKNEVPVDDGEAAANLIGLATIARMRQRHDQAIELAREAMESADRCGDSRHAIAARRILANSLRNQLLTEEAQQHLVKARLLCVLHDFRYDGTAIELALGWLQYENAILNGTVISDAAEPCFKRALSEAKAMNHTVSQIEASLGLAWCAFSREDASTAAQHINEAAGVTSFSLYQEASAGLMVARGGLALLHGQLEHAEWLYNQAQNACAASELISWEADSYLGLATVYIRQQRWAMARKSEQKSRELACLCGSLKMRLVDLSLEHVRSVPSAVPF